MTKFSRRDFCNIAASSLMAGFGVPAVAAERYPARPIRLIVGFPPGGAADLVARLIGERLRAADDSAPILAPYGAGIWTFGDHLRHLAAHNGHIPLPLDEFGRCVICVRRGFFTPDA